MCTHKMSYSVVIPTKRSFDDVAPLLADIEQQTQWASKVIIVLDKLVSPEEESHYKEQCHTVLESTPLMLITNNTSDFIPQQGASYVRNTWIASVETDFLLGVDDDNRLPSDFVEKIAAVQRVLGEDSVVVPTEYYRDTTIIRSQWYKRYYAWLGWAKPSFLDKEETYAPLMFCSSNCFRWKTSVLQVNTFPKEFWFVAEDFARSTMMTQWWTPLYVTAEIAVNHMMRDKNVLEDSYIATEDFAFLKGRNRVRWVKSMQLSYRIKYFITGLRIHTASLLYKIWRYAPRPKKYPLTKALLHGTYRGCVTKK